MKALNLAVALAVSVTTLSSSSLADNRDLTKTHMRSDSPQPGRNPIRLEGQIREVTASEDIVTIRLHRDRYPIVASSGTRVRWNDGRRAHCKELQTGDSIRVEGELEGNVIHAERVTILMRIEHRGGK